MLHQCVVRMFEDLAELSLQIYLLHSVTCWNQSEAEGVKFSQGQLSAELCLGAILAMYVHICIHTWTS